MIDSHHQNTPPLVSIIIPSFNGEKFIKEAIDSVLNQSFQDFEIIVSDDDSTDKTREIVQEYRNDHRILFFQNNKRLGIGGNWNRGIERSKGKYIKILCQDDIIKSHYLKEVVAVLEDDSSVTLVTTFEQFFGESDRVRNANDIPCINRTDGQKVQKSLLKKGNWIGGPTAVTFRRADLEVGMFDTSFVCGLDYEMWLRLLGKGNLYVVPHILFQSRIHKDQATTGCNRNLGFDKDNIRILNKIKKSPKIYGDIDVDVVQQAMDRSNRMFVDKSFTNNDVRTLSVLYFLQENMGFYNSVTLLIRRVLFRFFKKFRHILKTQ